MKVTVKIGIIFAIGFGVVGCGSSANEYLPKVIPAGLKDCKFYEIINNGSYMQVIRCPNSSTTSVYTVGKSRAYSTVIDG